MLVHYNRELRRVYVVGKRIHHGLCGAVCLTIGSLLVIHDRADFPWPFKDRLGDS